MTSHELAKELLAGEDLPITLSIENPQDKAYTNDVRVNTVSHNSEPAYILIAGWISSDDQNAFAPWANYEDME